MRSEDGDVGDNKGEQRPEGGNAGDEGGSEGGWQYRAPESRQQSADDEELWR